MQFNAKAKPDDLNFELKSRINLIRRSEWFSKMPPQKAMVECGRIGQCSAILLSPISFGHGK